MKKSANNFLFILVVTLGLVGNTFAQAPEGIIYQAEARDVNGNLIRNQTLDVLIKIIQDDASGLVVWEGLHEVTTSNFGIFVLVIGHGTNTDGYEFENIDWGNHPHFLNVQVKTTKGKNASAWIDMGTQQLLSVPYALHSKTAETVITETDPLFNTWDKSTGIYITESQISDLDHFTNSDETDPAVAVNFDFTDAANGDLLQYNGTKWVKVTPDYLTTEIDGSVTNEIQMLSIQGNQLSLTDGNTVSLPINTTVGEYYYLDKDQDGLGNPDCPVWVPESVAPPSYHVNNNGDCADDNPFMTSISPEICDGLDNDCDGQIDEDFPEKNTICYVDGVPGILICDPNNPFGLICSAVPPPLMDMDNDGFTSDVDCNDNDASIYPGAPEICGDGIDQDCDGSDLSCGTTVVVEVTNPHTGKTWMDRNLGASQVATSSTDAASYGDLYQWGRGTDGHEKRTSGTTSTLSSSDTPGYGNFITTYSSYYDWRSPQNDNLWQGVSGINNPCPTGYCLPTAAEWDAERTSWSINIAAGAFASPLKLPVAGYRNNSNGSLSNAGSYGRYWSSTVVGYYSWLLYFSSSDASMYSGYRARGYSVRCLKD